MESSTICAMCRHLLRLPTRTRTQYSSKVVPFSAYHVRPLSTSFIRAQNAPSETPTSRPQAPMPTTAGTVTTNVTAQTPPPASDESKGPNHLEMSTAELQKQIRGSMGATRRGSVFGIKAAKRLRAIAPGVTKSYITYGVTEVYLKSCAAQAPYTIAEDQRLHILSGKGPPKTAQGEDLGQPEAESWWFKELEFQPTFSSWSQITYLHMYLLTVRLRAMQDKSQFIDYQRYLIEHFSNAAEDKMQILHNMQARGIRNRYLKDLFIQWRGLLAAYDEGVIKGDAVLAAAVWRNLFKGREDVDWEKVAMVVAYMRKAINKLNEVPLDALGRNLDSGRAIWNVSKIGLRGLVHQQSHGIDQVLEEPPN